MESPLLRISGGSLLRVRSCSSRSSAYNMVNDIRQLTKKETQTYLHLQIVPVDESVADSSTNSAAIETSTPESIDKRLLVG